MAELCRQHNLVPKTVYNWKEKFVEGGRSSFSDKNSIIMRQTTSHLTFLNKHFLFDFVKIFILSILMALILGFSIITYADSDIPEKNNHVSQHVDNCTEITIFDTDKEHDFVGCVFSADKTYPSDYLSIDSMVITHGEFLTVNGSLNEEVPLSDISYFYVKIYDYDLFNKNGHVHGEPIFEKMIKPAKNHEVKIRIDDKFNIGTQYLVVVAYLDKNGNYRDALSNTINIVPNISINHIESAILAIQNIIDFILFDLDYLLSEEETTTGKVSLDRVRYPVPFGDPIGLLDDSSFPLHTNTLGNESLKNGDLTIYVKIEDDDFNVSSGIDSIAMNTFEDVGPVKISVIRDSEIIVLATAGGHSYNAGEKTAGENPISGITTELGPIMETEPNSGIFEFNMAIKYTDGPSSDECPPNNTRLNGNNYCILNGDVLQVEYIDPVDEFGDSNSFFDSALFGLVEGRLFSDSSVYTNGSKILLTLVEPDLDLDSKKVDKIDLDIVGWYSNGIETSIGSRGFNPDMFDPGTSYLRETGPSTTIFQGTINMPYIIGNNENIILEYTDWGVSNYVGEEYLEVQLRIRNQ